MGETNPATLKLALSYGYGDLRADFRPIGLDGTSVSSTKLGGSEGAGYAASTIVTPGAEIRGARKCNETEAFG